MCSGTMTSVQVGHDAIAGSRNANPRGFLKKQNTAITNAKWRVMAAIDCATRVIRSTLLS
jgi:hypothetical protein